MGITLSHFISQFPPTWFPLLTAIGMCHFLPVHHLGIAFGGGSGRRSKHNNSLSICIVQCYLNRNSLYGTNHDEPLFTNHVILLLSLILPKYSCFWEQWWNKNWKFWTDLAQVELSSQRTKCPQLNMEVTWWCCQVVLAEDGLNNDCNKKNYEIWRVYQILDENLQLSRLAFYFPAYV